MAVLVCGGAGYVGSHIVYELVEQNENIIVVDNLSTGHIQAVNKKALFYHGDVRDKNFLHKVFSQHEIHSVYHFAASSLVGESMQKPLAYFNNNVYGLQVLLETMVANNVKKIIFSSTCAVYGTPNVLPIDESTLCNPQSSYGESKLIMEKMMKWVDSAHGIKYVSLRYFNAAGALSSGLIGEDHAFETHLIPLVLQVALGKKECISIFGDDYNTPDGTCIRDYIHVTDLAHAHIKAMNYLNNTIESNIFNLGTGQGYSVKEIIDAAEKITQKSIKFEIVQKRLGDASILIASNENAKKFLDWQPKYDIHSIIETAWRWHKKNTNGFVV